MKTLYYFWIIACCLVSSANAQHTFKTSIHFESGKFVLKPESMHVLDMLADSLATYQTYKITLRGHTDNTGDSSGNQGLSQHRVASVQAYLTAKGIPSSAFSVSAHGMKKPVAENTTEEGKQKNRRVEILVAYTRVPVIIPEKPSILTLYRKLNTGGEDFNFRTDRDTFLRCMNGTILNIPAGTFTGKSRTVTLTVREYYKKSDMLLGNLNTMSNGSVLETQGMIYTEAVDENGKAVNIQRGKTISVLIPVDTVRNDMKLFRGNRNAHDSMMNWETNFRSNLLRLPGSVIDNCNGWSRRGGRIDKCPLFFCKIKAMFRPRRTNGSGWVTGRDEVSYGCGALDSLFRLYNVKSMRKLMDTLRKERLRNIEKDMSGGTSSLNDVSYYVFNTPSLGWINCDAFSKYDSRNLTNMTVNLKNEKNVDCKLVFSRMGSILQGIAAGGIYQFSRIPKGIKAWVVALKYEDGKAFLFMKELNTGSEPVDVDFKEYSLDEIRKKLKVLDELTVR